MTNNINIIKIKKSAVAEKLGENSAVTFVYNKGGDCKWRTVSVCSESPESICGFEDGQYKKFLTEKIVGGRVLIINDKLDHSQSSKNEFRDGHEDGETDGRAGNAYCPSSSFKISNSFIEGYKSGYYGGKMARLLEASCNLHK